MNKQINRKIKKKSYDSETRRERNKDEYGKEVKSKRKKKYLDGKAKKEKESTPRKRLLSSKGESK